MTSSDQPGDRSDHAGLLARDQIVHKGDPMLEIDPRPFQAALTDPQDQLAQDQTAFQEAQID